MSICCQQVSICQLGGLPAPVPDLPANGECGFWGGLGLVGSVVAPATRLGTLPFAVAGRFLPVLRAATQPGRTSAGCALADVAWRWLRPPLCPGRVIRARRSPPERSPSRGGRSWSGRELHPPTRRKRSRPSASGAPAGPTLLAVVLCRAFSAFPCGHRLRAAVHRRPVAKRPGGLRAARTGNDSGFVVQVRFRGRFG